MSFSSASGCTPSASIGGANEVRAIQTEALNRREKRGRFDDYFVVRRDHCFANEIERLLAAGGDDEPVRCDGRALAFHECTQLLSQRLPAFGRAVLQHAAGVFREHRVGGDANAFSVEERGIRKAAREADDARFAKQFEQLANGRGFYVF